MKLVMLMKESCYNGSFEKQSSRLKKPKINCYAAGLALVRQDSFVPWDFDDKHEPEISGCRVRIAHPDVEVDKVMSFESLSDEAKFVVDLVLNTPAEFAEYILTPIGRISKPRLSRYLRRNAGWGYNKVKRVFTEIADFVGGLPD